MEPGRLARVVLTALLACSAVASATPAHALIWDFAEKTSSTKALAVSITGDSGTTTQTPDGEQPPATDMLTVDGFPASGVRTVAWGAMVPIEGRLTQAEGGGAGFVLWVERVVGTTGEPLTEVQREPSGAFAFELRAPTARTSYRMAFGEIGGVEPILSRTFVIWPKVRLSLATPVARIRKASALKIRGTLAPVHGGRPVVVRIEQLQRTKEWKVVRSIALAAPKGAFATSYRFPAIGTYRLSAQLVSSDKDHAPTATGFKRVVVVK